VAAIDPETKNAVSVTLADSKGDFALEQLPAGRYRLLAWGPAYSVDTDPLPGGPEVRFATVESVNSTETEPVRIALQAGARLEVQSALASDCWGAETVSIVSSEGWPSPWFDAMPITSAGTTIESMPIGAYRLSFPNLRRECIVESSEPHVNPATLSIRFSASRKLSLALALAKGEISGAVPASPEPATVTLDQPAAVDALPVFHAAEVSDTGVFRFRGIPRGQYRLRLLRNGALAGEQSITLKDGEKVAVRFEQQGRNE
jgi:hypothetical protein